MASEEESKRGAGDRLTPPAGAPAGGEVATDGAGSDLDQIAAEAWTYFYPLVLMDITRRIMTQKPPGTPNTPGPNRFSHKTEFPPADFREVVRPNFDTLYSPAWLDLTDGPVVVSTKDTEGRYFMLPMIDMWTDVFANPGSRATGTKAQAWAVVPQGWKGDLPKGVGRIDAPTPHVWVIGRTQTNGPADFAAVHKIQAGYGITPLSQWEAVSKGAKVVLPPLKPDPKLDLKTEPLNQVAAMGPQEFFTYAARLLKENPPHVTDWAMAQRNRRLGIEQGEPFDWASAPPEVKAALTKATQGGVQALKTKAPTLASVFNGWQMNTNTMGVYGNYYLKRAIIALIGLGANLPEDAVYPMAMADADGKPVASPNKYTITFPKGGTPPVGAFWSLTMYDEEGFQVPNNLNRFAIGDRDKLKSAPDGSLTIYIQPDSPGADKEPNWLPAPPKGVLGVTLRMYDPAPQALNGIWVPPPITKAA